MPIDTRKKRLAALNFAAGGNALLPDPGPAGIDATDRGTLLGLLHSLGEKVIKLIGKAHRKPTLPPISAYLQHEEQWKDHVAEIETEMWEGRVAVKDYRDQQVAQSRVVQIEADAKRAAVIEKCHFCGQPMPDGAHDHKHDA